MNNITLKREVILPHNTRTIEMQIGSEGVRVVLDDVYQAGYDLDVKSIQWDELSDPERLYELFQYEAVKTFKVLVELLAKVHGSRHIYEALI
jgi:hypothetical protein